MSSKPQDPDRADLVGLLQPFVDGELSADEHRIVTEQVDANPEYRAIVDAQLRVRTLLRELALDGAPAELRTRIVAELDAIDRDRERGWAAPVIGRLRAFSKGALLMLPAAAAALALFFVVREGGLTLDGDAVEGGLGQSFALQHRRGADEDEGGQERFPIQIAAAGSLPAGVERVSAPIDSRSITYRDAEGRVMMDRQRPVTSAEPSGTRQVFRGHTYFLDRDARGRAHVEFALGPVHHSLTVEQGHTAITAVDASEPDFGRLLELGHALHDAK